MAFTVGTARLAEGYSGWDHLLDNEPLRVMTGRTYADERAAAIAAGRLLKGTQDRRVGEPPVWLLDADGTGSCWWTDGTRA